MASKEQSLHKTAFRFLISAIYFLYWSYAFALGTIFGILVAAFAPLLVELFGGVYHAGEVPAPGSHWPRWMLMASYWLLLLAFAIRHLNESKAQQREKYSLAFGLGRLYEFDRTLKAEGKAVDLTEVLKHIYAMFEPLKVAHVALHRKNGGRITIAHNEVFPAPTDPSSLPTFEEGKGVAGKVFKDSVTRYVPRIYLPQKRRWLSGVLLPHALIFEFEAAEEARNEPPAILKIAIDLNVVESPPNGTYEFNSFVSVPVKPAGSQACDAVLSLDFETCNSLKKADIALAYAVAMAVGRIIAEPLGQAAASK